LWLTAPLKGEALARQPRAKAVPSAVIARSPSSFTWRVLGIAILPAVLLIDAGWWTYQRYFNPTLRVTFLSVGEGDAAVVRFPGSRVMLIDGGGSFGGTFDPGERIVAPFLWSQKIMHVDYMTLSHPDRDHFGGLIFIARNFSPSEFWTSGTDSADESYATLLNAVDKAGARRLVCNSASVPLQVREVTIRCVGPLATMGELKENNASMVLRISEGSTTFLFSGDLEAKGRVS
jgi:competence protein ComEC